MRLERVASIAVLCLVSASLLFSSAAAHDYWLSQELRALEPGDVCTIRLLVGDKLESELERPLQVDMTTRYEWHTSDETVNLLETVPDSTLPVFERRVSKNEMSLLVMDRKFFPIESTVGQFLQFLDHEELPKLAARFQDASPDDPLRRRYARAIKALVRTGEPSTGDMHSKTVGQTFEIRLLRNPHLSEPGAELPVHVQFEGEDVNNQLVMAFVEGSDGAVTTATARTDRDGIAKFALEDSGLWVLRATYLRESQNQDKMDWDTYYATFSFVYP